MTGFQIKISPMWTPTSEYRIITVGDASKRFHWIAATLSYTAFPVYRAMDADKTE